jgi:hypothetical protein
LNLTIFELRFGHK